MCLLLRLCSVLALLALAACDSGSQATHDSISLSGESIAVSVPQRLRSIQAIDLSAVRAVATVNGVETELQLTASGQYSGQISVPAQSALTFRIEFVEIFSGQLLTLARIERNITTGAADTLLTLQSEDYDYDSFDSDGDNASNILERQSDTSPLDSGEVPDFINVDVFAELPAELVTAGFSDYQIVATVGTGTVSTDATAGEFRQIFTAVRQVGLTAEVRLVENVTGRDLTVGIQTRQIATSGDSALVIFDRAGWNFDFDEDADGLTDVQELAAGTDLLNVNSTSGPGSAAIEYAVAFDIPAEISNTESVFATLVVDGRNINLSRIDNTYTGQGTTVAGAPINIEAQIMDTFQGTALVLATFGGQATPIPNATLRLDGFNTSIDTDGDGLLNYIELAQGTDPFNGSLQCTPVGETLTATITDDAYVENTVLFDNAFLRLEANRRVSIIRFQFIEGSGTVTSASLNLTVGNDAGDGELSVFAESNFDWNDQAASLVVPTGELAGALENNWVSGETYSFSLNPALVTGDVSLIIRHEGGDDVAFQSSDAIARPALEVTIDRCE